MWSTVSYILCAHSAAMCIFLLQILLLQNRYDNAVKQVEASFRTLLIVLHRYRATISEGSPSPDGAESQQSARPKLNRENTTSMNDDDPAALEADVHKNTKDANIAEVKAGYIQVWCANAISFYSWECWYYKCTLCLGIADEQNMSCAFTNVIRVRDFDFGSLAGHNICMGCGLCSPRHSGCAPLNFSHETHG